MDLDTLPPLTKPRLKVKISQQDNSSETFAKSVLEGLSASPKYLSPKYFYDETGSQLFEQICELPEYYVTRLERTIIERYSDEIAETAGDSVLIELGSGEFRKDKSDNKDIPATLSRASVHAN